MSGCRTLQCLLKKDENWQAQDDDQDFKRTSNYFLTGISDRSPDQSPAMSLNPVRHGANEVWISNTSSDFFIFKKVSIERLSHIDVHGIWSWRDLEGSYHKLFEQFPRAFEVKNGKHQWWNHEPGNEFLAANPVDIPGFSVLIKESEQEFGFDNGGRRWPYNTNDGAFHFSYRNDHENWKIDHKTPPPGNSSNLFSRLPNEPYLSVL